MKFRTKNQVLSESTVDPGEEQQVYRELPTKLKALENSHPVATVLKLLANVRFLWAMLRDTEFRLTLKSKAVIIASLAYFILPFDLVPDYIPGLGYMDDGLVIGAVLRALNKELDSYRDFTKRRLSTF